MAQLVIKYKASDDSLPLIDSCASKTIIEEQCSAIRTAFEEIEVTFEYDDDWGFLVPIALNGRRIESNV